MTTPYDATERPVFRIETETGDPTDPLEIDAAMALVEKWARALVRSADRGEFNTEAEVEFLSAAIQAWKAASTRRVLGLGLRH